MRQIRFGGAVSLDGYIAGPNGEYEWIPIDPDMDFTAMMARFDTFLMGRKTYDAWRTSGVGGSEGIEVWVFSRTLRQEDHPGVTVVAGEEKERLRELRSRPGKEIALYGGGELFRSLLALGEVDAVEVAVVPVLLGGGIPLLPAPADRASLQLRSHTVYPKTGTVLLDYAVTPAVRSASGRTGRGRQGTASR